MKEHVILSLTTIPNRLTPPRDDMGIKHVIDKLTNLSYSNYEIHLNIPFFNLKSGEEYIIPEWLENYESDKLKVFRTEDYGSITKILPTIERIENPEQIIISVDDDLEYIDGFIEYHLEKRKLYPDAALGFAGLGSMDHSCHFCTTLEKDTRVKILEGYKTISYKRSFFKDDFKEFSKGSWNDDMIISAYLGKENIQKIVMNYFEDTDFSARVESFPVVRSLPNESGGCTWFRRENIHDNHEYYYSIGYLER